MQEVYEIIGQAMSTATSLEELRANFHTVMASFNLDQYTYQVVQNDYLHNMKNFFVTTYPKEWEQHYLKQNYFDEDPLVHRYMNSVSPFLWGVDSIASSSPKAKKMIFESSDFNLQHGIGIPIAGPNKSFSILTLCSKDGTAKEVTEIYNHFYKDLFICGLLFHNAFLSINQNYQMHPQLDLTNKEIECLKWICTGKSNNEIGSILGISINAVKERNKSIFKKLGVYNRIDAIMKAYRYKIVEL